jgi:hypothetical protein
MARNVGIDIGTGFLSGAEKSKEDPNKIQFRKIRDCFFKVTPDDFMGGNHATFGEKMLKRSGAHFIKMNEGSGDDTLYVLGDSAYDMAGTMHKETLRPMAKGVLNPDEPASAAMVAELIKAVVGEPEAEDDQLFFCVPAQPVDAEYDVVYHESTLKEIFGDLGYKNVSVMHEGLAVIFSELSENNFTGIGMSFGAGMVNVTYAFMGVPVLSFSISKGGDYIDQSAAKQVNDTANTVTYRKEQGMDLRSPKDEYEKAIAVYYKNLLKYLVEQIKYLYKSKDKRELPVLRQPIPLVVSGGTSMIGGFKEALQEAIDSDKDFPIDISEIRPAEEALFAVANGLYQAARLGE